MHPGKPLTSQASTASCGKMGWGRRVSRVLSGSPRSPFFPPPLAVSAEGQRMGHLVPVRWSRGGQAGALRPQPSLDPVLPSVLMAVSLRTGVSSCHPEQIRQSHLSNTPLRPLLRRSIPGAEESPGPGGKGQRQTPGGGDGGLRRGMAAHRSWSPDRARGSLCVTGGDPVHL